jgi:glycosyltransferase involved in cell wall biosynthesis
MNVNKKVLLCSVFAEALYKSRYELIMNFIERGFEVILVAPEADDFTKRIFSNLDVRYIQINLDRTGTNPLRDIKTIQELTNIMSVEKPSITYAFGGAKAAIYCTFAASRNQVDSNYCMINGLGSIYRGKGLKNKLIEKVMTQLFKYSLKKSDGVLFQNNDDLQVFVNKGIVDQSKTKIVNGSGVNLSKFPYSIAKTDQIKFLFIGRLLRDKGIYEFVEAAKKIKGKYVSTEFWVVGGYDTNPTSVSEKEMNEWINKGLIKYFGRQENIYNFYKDASVFVLPSYHEGTPRTNLEAMAVGRPIITTDAPGCRETVMDNINGFLVPIKDVESLTVKMKYFIENPHMIKKMGDESNKIAISKYDVHKVNESIVSFILRDSKIDSKELLE